MKFSDDIERYLLGQMSKVEALAFEKEVRANDELAEELEFRRFELKVSKQMNINDLKKKLAAFEHENQTANLFISEETKVKPLKSVSKMRYLNFYRAIAASIVILFGFFYYMSSQYSNDSLYQLAYKSETPDYGNQRSADNTSSNFESKYTDILIQQNRIEVSKAITYFQSFNTQSPLYIQAQFNLGHAFLLNKEYEKSLNTFRQLLNASISNTPLKQEVQYDIAMTLIQMGNDDEAQTTLNEIVNDPSHRFKNSALILLEKLNNFWRKI